MDDLGETRRISSPKRPTPKRLSCEGGTGAKQVSACRKHGVLRASRWTREKRGLNRIFFTLGPDLGEGEAGGCKRNDGLAEATGLMLEVVKRREDSVEERGFSLALSRVELAG